MISAFFIIILILYIFLKQLIKWHSFFLKKYKISYCTIKINIEEVYV
jgi:hypothetical protein